MMAISRLCSLKFDISLYYLSDNNPSISSSKSDLNNRSCIMRYFSNSDSANSFASSVQALKDFIGVVPA